MRAKDTDERRVVPVGENSHEDGKATDRWRGAGEQGKQQTGGGALVSKKSTRENETKSEDDQQWTGA